MKWIAVALLLAVVGLAGYALYVSAIGNPRVAGELRNEPNGEIARRVMLLTLPDGRTIPVNYLREGGMVYAGADGPWWRALRGDGVGAGVGVEVELLVMGEKLRGRATAIEGDPAHTRDVFARLRPSVPAWLPDALNGVLVEIELESPQP